MIIKTPSWNELNIWTRLKEQNEQKKVINKKKKNNAQHISQTNDI